MPSSPAPPSTHAHRNMATPSLQLAFLILSIIFSTSTTAVGGAFLSFPSASPPPPPSLSNGHSPQFRDFPLSSASLLEQILAHLGFQELSISVSTVLSEYPALSRWNGPVTVFAPSDASVDSCASCPLPRLLAEHVVPGFFATSTLQGLAFGTKIETMNPRHCVAVTSASGHFANATRIYIDGAEITRPDLFDNGIMIVHGLDGPVSPLSQSSCTDASPRPSFEAAPPSFAGSAPLIMTLMLRDAMLRLRSGGYGVLALAMKAKFNKLVALENATIFAVEDDFIFSDPHNYAGDVSFHIVPNRYLAGDDLQNLPVGSTLGTMDEGQDLVVTSAGTPAGGTVQINGARLKIPEVIRNARVVVHSLFVPFSHLQMGSLTPGPTLSVPTDGSDGGGKERAAGDASESLEELGGCGLGPTQIEDGHGP